MNEKLLRAEADAYRSALVRVLCDATCGPRKTLDKDAVAAILGPALDRGNELFSRAKEA